MLRKEPTFIFRSPVNNTDSTLTGKKESSQADTVKKPEFDKPWYEAFAKVPFHQIDYVKSMFVNGEDLSKPPRIKISTIHGAKGGEATNVVLYLNQTENTLKGSKRSKEKYDEEQRVWYVGITRTIDNLYLIKCKNKKKEYKI